MTLILNHASDRWILQVSDRLVSRAGTPFDRAANKALVVVLPDSALCLAYTGLGYLEGLPTDCWLAQELLGAPLETWRDGRHPMAQFSPQDRLTSRFDVLISRLLMALPRAVRREPNPAWRRLAPTIVATGYQWRARRQRRTIIGALSPTADGSYTYETATRPDVGHFVVTAHPRGNVSQLVWDELKPRLRNPDVEPVRIAMVEAIRSTSALFPGVVGCETISVAIDGSGPSVDVTFDSPAAVRGELVSDKVRVPLTVAYTPWVLSPGLVLAPTAHSGAGTWEIATAGWSIRVNGTKSPPGPLESAASSQVRPPQPT